MSALSESAGRVERYALAAASDQALQVTNTRLRDVETELSGSLGERVDERLGAGTRGRRGAPRADPGRARGRERTADGGHARRAARGADGGRTAQPRGGRGNARRSR